MTYSFGEVAWGTDLELDKKPSTTKDLYMRLEDGDNEVRIVTPMYQYTYHKYKPNENDKGYGTKIRCSATKDNSGDCALCRAGEKVSLGWYVGVISRKGTNSYKILSMSKLAMGQLLKLVKNTKSWGDPTKYDINIIQDPKGGPTGFYNVQPLGKSPLSAEDQVLKDKADLDFLRARVVPPTPEDTLDKMNKVLAGEPLWVSKEEYKAKKTGSSGSTPQVQKPQPKKTVVPVAADDEEFEDA